MVFNGFWLGLVGFGGWWTYWACLKHWAYLQMAILIRTLMIKLLVFRVPKFADHVFLYREIVVKKSVILVFSRFSSYPMDDWLLVSRVFFWFHPYLDAVSPQKVEKIYPQGLRLSNMGMVNPSFLYDCPFKTTICREFPIATMFDFRMGERKTITINILWLICSFVFNGIDLKLPVAGTFVAFFEWRGVHFALFFPF